MHRKILATAALILPCAAVLTLSAPAAAGTSCTNLWCQSSQSWSDGGFGSSYSLWSGIETKKDHPDDTAYDATYLKAGADFSATAKVLGKSQSIAHVMALATNNQGSTWGYYWVDIGGTILAWGSLSNTVNVGWSRTFFHADDSIHLLGVKISLDGKATGELGVDVTPALQNGAIVLTADPYVGAYGDVDAHVGVACAGVGVSGSLTALDVHAPVSVSATIGAGNALDYDVTGSYSLHTLDGKLKVKLSYCGSSDSKTLVDFDGFTAGSTFLNKSGTLSL